MQVNTNTLRALIAKHADDGEMTGVILEALESFENYHQAIYRLELKRELYLHGAMDQETYREEIPYLDGIRTTKHNAVISNVKLLNRLAEQEGFEPFYAGVVSEERPYRTELADAVLQFVSETIDNRVKGK